MVVTVGSQQALDLVTRIFATPATWCSAEAPSYVGALGVFKAYQCDVVHVEMDEHGLVPSALRDAIATVQAAGKRIKFVYTIPNYHNPAGVTLAASGAPEILEICREADVLVLEDNPYGLLGFDEEPYRALRADEPDGVIYLGSFSKTFASGCGSAGRSRHPPCATSSCWPPESATLCPPSFTQTWSLAYLGRARLAQPGQAVQGDLPRPPRRDAPRLGVDTKAMLPRAVTARVAYASGTGFYADGLGSRQLRLSDCSRRRSGSPKGCAGSPGRWTRSRRAAHVRQPFGPARRRAGAAGTVAAHAVTGERTVVPTAARPRARARCRPPDGDRPPRGPVRPITACAATAPAAPGRRRAGPGCRTCAARRAPPPARRPAAGPPR